MMFTNDSAVKQAIHAFLQASGTFMGDVIDRMAKENQAKLAAMAEAGGKITITVVMPAAPGQAPTVAVAVRHDNGTTTPIVTAEGLPVQPTH